MIKEKGPKEKKALGNYIDINSINRFRLKNTHEKNRFREISFLKAATETLASNNNLSNKDTKIKKLLKLNKNSPYKARKEILENPKILSIHRKAVEDISGHKVPSYKEALNNEYSESNVSDNDNFFKRIKKSKISEEIDSVDNYIYAIQNVTNFFLNANMVNNEFDPDLKDDSPEKSLLMAKQQLKRQGLFFRGEPDDYVNIIPSFARSIYHFKNENKIYHRMLIESPNDFSKGKYLVDKLAMMQHHGLNTRVLDITTNALIALYFAISKNPQKNGYVIPFLGKSFDDIVCTSGSDRVAIKAALSQLNFEQKLLISLYIQFKSPTDILQIDKGEKLYPLEESKIRDLLKLKNEDDYFKKTKNAIDSLYHAIRMDSADFTERIQVKDITNPSFVLPEYVDDRIVRQSGAFLLIGLNGVIESVTQDKKESTMQNMINDAISPYEISYNCNDYLNCEYGENNTESSCHPNIRIKINKKYKEKILNELDILGINKATVYSDLDSKADYINNMYSY